MLYKTLFCLGVSTLLAASLIPAMTARATTHPIKNHPNFPLNSVDYHPSSRFYLEESKSIHMLFAGEGTKSSGVTTDSSRPPRK